MTEWKQPFPFRLKEADPYLLVRYVYGGADKTICVGTLQTKGQNKEPLVMNEIVHINTRWNSCPSEDKGKNF